MGNFICSRETSTMQHDLYDVSKPLKAIGMTREFPRSKKRGGPSSFANNDESFGKCQQLQ